jgi:hypothetical protein
LFDAYRGLFAALATCHNKAEAIGPALKRILGLSLEVPSGIDTDALGTFTGEVPRSLSMHETARAKARLGMRATGLKLGLASEGSFGPDPLVGIIPAAEEILVFIDDVRDIEITERLLTHKTNYASLEITGDVELEAFIARAGFPEHGLVVRGNNVLRKGITEEAELRLAIAEARSSGMARIETDMRAHLNPTRMAEIARLAERLAYRLATPCPRCGCPGFGCHAQNLGLACRDCGTPSFLIKNTISRCVACGHEQVVPREDGLTQADPRYCPECNP